VRATLVWLAMMLQDSVNFLCRRHFTFKVGVMKDNSAAGVVLVTKRFLKAPVSLLVDVKTFLRIANDIMNTEPRVLEKQGFVINKKGDQMAADYHIPAWAFPRAAIEAVMLGEEIINAYKSAKKAAEKFLSTMKEAGVSDEELDKLRKTMPQFFDDTQKPTLH